MSWWRYILETLLAVVAETVELKVIRFRGR